MNGFNISICCIGKLKLIMFGNVTLIVFYLFGQGSYFEILLSKWFTAIVIQIEINHPAVCVIKMCSGISFNEVLLLLYILLFDYICGNDFQNRI